MATRLLVVDDHAVIRDGLRILCSQDPELEMVGEATNGVEALEQYEVLLPDVVVMDVGMPAMDGVNATAALLERHPGSKVVALSMHADSYYIDLMREAGALGYVLKDEAFEALASVVRKVMSGETAFPS